MDAERTNTEQGGCGMSNTLNLVDRLLERGRTFQQHGQFREAATLFTRLVAFRSLAPETCEELHSRLAELHTKRRNYRRACRHLTIALRYQPDNAEYHARLAAALRARDNSQWDRASEHYARALAIDLRPEWTAEAALLDIRLGRVEQGIQRLRDAVDQNPADPSLLQRLVRGLRWANQPDEARAALRTALFRNRFDPRFQQCWRDFQFRETRQAQLREMRARQQHTPDDGPILLPFVRVEPTQPEPELRGTILRHDASSTLNPPHQKRSGRNIDQRNIQ